MTRQILFWVHLCIGVVAGAAILIMSATGVLLAFERQVLQLVDTRAGQLVTAIASAGGGLLVWTGLSLALRRLRTARVGAEDRDPSAEPQQQVGC